MGSKLTKASLVLVFLTILLPTSSPAFFFRRRIPAWYWFPYYRSSTSRHQSSTFRPSFGRSRQFPLGSIWGPVPSTTAQPSLFNSQPDHAGSRQDASVGRPVDLSARPATGISPGARSKPSFYHNLNFPSPNGFFYAHLGTCAGPQVTTLQPQKPDEIEPGTIHIRVKRSADMQAFIRGAFRLGAKSVEFNTVSPCQREFAGNPGLADIEIETIVTVAPGDEIRFAGQCGIQLRAFPSDADVPTCYLVSPSMNTDMRRAWSEHPDTYRKVP